MRPSWTSFSSVSRGGLAANGVEARQDDGLGRVVDDQVHPGDGLERADVPALAADDPALHVLARQREDGHGRLARLLGRDPLDRDRDDLASAFLALLARPLLDLAHGPHGLALGVVDHLRPERLPGLLGRHLRDLLEPPAVLLGRVLELLPHHLELPVPVVQLLRPPVELVELAVDRLLLLGEPLLLALDLLAARAEVLLRISPERSDLVLGLDERLTRQALGLTLGLEDDLLGPGLRALSLGLGDGLAHQEADRDPEGEGHDTRHHRFHRFASKEEKAESRPIGPCSAVRPKWRWSRVRGGRAAPRDPRSDLLPATTGWSDRACQARFEQLVIR